MDEYSIRDVVAMLVVLYKRIEDLEYEIKGGFRSASMETYLMELKKEAHKIKL